MEPSPKRRRLVNLLETELHQSLEIVHDDSDSKEIDGDSILEYNSGDELEQKRAELNDKLKSAFENIFEKYGKDFDGIGDEIDLYTGEIIVDNGHLLRMEGETDAGDRFRGRQMLRALTVEPEDLSLDYVEDEDSGQKKGVTVDRDSEVDEDYEILRGLRAQPQYSAPLSNSDFEHQPEIKPMDSGLTRVGPGETNEQLTSELYSYDSEISSHPSKGRKKAIMQEVGRSPSRISTASLWAPEGPSRRRRAIQKDIDTSNQPKQADQYHGLEHVGMSPSLPIVSLRSKTRTPYTKEDDKILFQWIRKIRKEGRGLGETIWVELHAMVGITPIFPRSLLTTRSTHNILGRLGGIVSETNITAVYQMNNPQKMTQMMIP